MVFPLCTFRGEQQIDLYDPPVGKFLDFFVMLNDNGFKYSTLNTARTAVSAIVTSVNNQSLVCILWFQDS